MGLRPISVSYAGPSPIGKTWDGRFLYRLRGSEGEGDGGGTGDGGSGDGDGGDGSGSGDGSGTGDGATGGDGDTSGNPPVTREELEKALNRMKAADKRASDAEKKVKEFEDAQLGEAEKATKELKEAREQNEVLLEENRTLKVQNAFLSTNDVKWHDPEIAMKQADLSEVVNDEGEIDKKALKKSLDDLAKAKPFLVNSASGGGEGGSGGGGGNPSGAGVGSGRQNGGKGTSEEELYRKYPALRR